MTGPQLIPFLPDFYRRSWPIVVGTSQDGKGPTYPNWQSGIERAEAEILLRQHRQAMVGVILGPRVGFWDLDVDDEGGLPIVAKALGDDPTVTPMFQRPGRIPHRLFKWHERLNAVETNVVSIKDATGKMLVEFRLGHRGGAQTIFPASGGRKWLIHPDDCPFAPPPDCLVEFILATARRQAPSTRNNYVPPSGPASIATANLSNSTRGLIEFGAPQEGGWNHALFAAACDMAGCGVSQCEAEQVLIVAAQPWNRAEERRVIATIRSAYRHDRRPARPPRVRKPAKHHRPVTGLPTVRFSVPVSTPVGVSA